VLASYFLHLCILLCFAKQGDGWENCREGWVVLASRKGGGAMRYWRMADGEVACEVRGWCASKVLSGLMGKTQRMGQRDFLGASDTFRLDQAHESFGIWSSSKGFQIVIFNKKQHVATHTLLVLRST
jgi:hypothetical protein